MSNIKRKLTTILATDCVSFSKHMEENEENTLKSLNSCRSIIDKKIEDYNGKIFHIRSLNFKVLLIFKASIEFQKEILNMNDQTDITPKLSWRVGIHVDDVIIEKNNIYGTGVNVAARLMKINS